MIIIHVGHVVIALLMIIIYVGHVVIALLFIIIYAGHVVIALLFIIIYAGHVVIFAVIHHHLCPTCRRQTVMCLIRLKEGISLFVLNFLSV
ncbi:TPA: hypothetical protein ACTZ5N_004677 [Bacillus cereus]